MAKEHLVSGASLGTASFECVLVAAGRPPAKKASTMVYGKWTDWRVARCQRPLEKACTRLKLLAGFLKLQDTSGLRLTGRRKTLPAGAGTRHIGENRRELWRGAAPTITCADGASAVCGPRKFRSKPRSTRLPFQGNEAAMPGGRVCVDLYKAQKCALRRDWSNGVYARGFAVELGSG